MTDWKERPFPYTRSRNNKTLQTLREGPKTSEEVPEAPKLSSAASRFVGRLSAPTPSATAVWYLWGDERRAVRRYIELNEDYVRESIDQKNSKLRQRFNDSLWRLLCEEWMWGGYLTDEEIERYREEEPDDIDSRSDSDEDSNE